jgi:ABC-type transporter Mla subunit MlaD
MPNVATVGAQIALIVAEVTAQVPRFCVIAVANRSVQLAAVLSNVALVAADIAAVLTPVSSVISKVSPVAAQVAILAQRKRRSQYCKHHQT